MDHDPRFASRLRKLNKAYKHERRYFSIIDLDDQTNPTGIMVVTCRDIKYKDLLSKECPSGSLSTVGFCRSDEEVREFLDLLIEEAPKLRFRWFKKLTSVVVAGIDAYFMGK